MPPKHYFKATFCFSLINAVLLFILHYPWPTEEQKRPKQMWKWGKTIPRVDFCPRILLYLLKAKPSRCIIDSKQNNHHHKQAHMYTPILKWSWWDSPTQPHLHESKNLNQKKTTLPLVIYFLLFIILNTWHHLH